MKRTLLLLAKIAVSLALLAYLFSTTDLGAIERRVRSGDPLLLGVAVGVYGLMLLVSAWRWRVLLVAQGFDPRFRDLSASYLVATFFNNFLPSNIGGDLVRVRDSSRLTGSTTTSLAVVAIDRILGFGALYALATTAFIFGGRAVRHLAGARAVVAGLGGLFAVLAYVFFRPGVARILMARSGLIRFRWARERFEIVQAAVHVYRERVAHVWRAFGASLAIQTLFIYYYYVVAHALRIPLSWPACFLMVPLCTLVQTIPISFNGWGVRESVFILYFGQMGLSRDSALAFSIVGASLVVLLSFSGAIVWTSRTRGIEAPSAS